MEISDPAFFRDSFDGTPFRDRVVTDFAREDAAMRKMLGVVLIALFLVTPVWADNTFKESGKEVGQGVIKIGKDTGQAVKEGGKKVGQGFKQMGKETGQAAKKTSRTVGEWFRDVGQKTSEAFREMGRSIRRFFTGG
jgi:hypothetical protein